MQNFAPFRIRSNVNGFAQIRHRTRASGWAARQVFSAWVFRHVSEQNRAPRARRFSASLRPHPSHSDRICLSAICSPRLGLF